MLNYRKRSASHVKHELTEKALISHQKDLLRPEEKNTIIIPSEISKPEESVVNITSE